MAEGRRDGPSILGVPILFGFVVFLSALLLSGATKHLLPWFGGTRAIWTTSPDVFQTVLLRGYVYARALTGLCWSLMQFRVHLVVLIVASVSVFRWSFLEASRLSPPPA